MGGLILDAMCLYTHSACIWVAWKELKEYKESGEVERTCGSGRQRKVNERV